MNSAPLLAAFAAAALIAAPPALAQDNPEGGAPEQQATPAEPATPAQPADPATPAQPADPATPAQPATPATPAQPAAPPSPSTPPPGDPVAAAAQSPGEGDLSAKKAGDPGVTSNQPIPNPPEKPKRRGRR